VFDPPFRWFTPRDLLEMAGTDEDYRVDNAGFTSGVVADIDLDRDGRRVRYLTLRLLSGCSDSGTTP
jgi:release factor glutamine methyltransferase